jgi:hypothetical protein
MKIRVARKILKRGRFDYTSWGSGRCDTRRRALKRVEAWLGGYRGVVAMGRALGL